ncbi:DUF4126 domain-containing protein [Oculatella sp. LEGE 06141]|uniref:DUF4126 domain-containing protein n=1 Tax=Oculatella sp. LEGE 06141 TaxID=1828648 RepID=UPI00187F2706|nr:DUF4126 domain-containing protein [Oculatella sp. LEGE 06141]MBE9177167.1 DUF4126 domain-containing protein [Oculatella sp. LEGE 06141]
MIELLAALSASAAVGMRIALPLLLIGLLYGSDLWAKAPLLSRVPPPIILGTLVSWSCVELLLTKERLGQRFVQLVQLVFSPIVGAIVGITVARSVAAEDWMIGIIGVVGGLLALVLQLVQVGWFFRLQGLPLWVIFIQDFLCVSLVLFAFDAPTQGGLIALLLLWLAIRSTSEWHRWYRQQGSSGDRANPRRHKQDPD